MRKIDKYKPGVTKNLLLFLAGSTWVGVGIMLLILAFSWLSTTSHLAMALCVAAGVLMALLVHHWGFLRIVDKNLNRILPMNGKICLFAFIPWKSYFIIMIMVAMGSFLRHSAIPKPYLAILYIGIGLALLLSSVRYARIFLHEIKSGRC